jgi:hypothetical protein
MKSKPPSGPSGDIVFPPRRRVKELESANRIFTGEIYTTMGLGTRRVLNFTTENTLGPG